MKSWAKPTPELVTRAIASMPYLEQQRLLSSSVWKIL